VSDLIQLSALALRDRIHSGQVTSRQVVDAHIARIEAVNPIINAVVKTRYDLARSEADAADARIAKDSSDLPAFLGVPCTVKEHFQLAGFPQTGGLLRRKDKIATRDATAIQRMRDAGFVILGTTNVPEALTWYESYNKIYGRTRNPWDLGRTAGGSSGGEGAILAAGGSPIGLAGDTGGSIRMPCVFNGIVGHKSSSHLVPHTGTWPDSTQGLISKYKCLGPMGRTVADVRALMPILSGPDGEDPNTVECPDLDPDTVDLGNTRVYWFDDNGIVSPDADTSEAVQRAIDALRHRGFQVGYWRPERIKKSLEVWAFGLGHGSDTTFSDTLSDFSDPIHLGRQLLRWPLRKSDHIGPSLGLATIEKVISRLGGHGEAMLKLRLDFQQEVEDKLGENAVLICPSFHKTAPKHRWDCLKGTLGFSYSGVFNALELPATAVPTGLGSTTGLPNGVQVVGRRRNDALTLAVAEQLEQALGGWQLATPAGVS
jgi:fatty acid amide hydrolase 2